MEKLSYEVNSSDFVEFSSATTPFSAALVMVVGASQGFGREIAMTAARLLPHARKHFVLAGRSIEKMKEVCAQLSEVVDTTAEVLTSAVVCLDLSQPAEAVASTFVSEVLPLPEAGILYSHIYLFLNSGTITPIGWISSWQPGDVAACVSTNTIAFAVLVSQFLSWTTRLSAPWTSRPDIEVSNVVSPGSAEVCSPAPQFTVRLVNVSSILHHIPHDSLGAYCMTKSARAMLMQVVALEMQSLKKTAVVGVGGKKQDKGRALDFKCLSWSPGPMETAMVQSIRDSNNPALAEITECPMISPGISATLLWKLLAKNEFSSGSHIDVYDVIEK